MHLVQMLGAWLGEIGTWLADPSLPGDPSSWVPGTDPADPGGVPDAIPGDPQPASGQPAPSPVQPTPGQDGGRSGAGVMGLLSAGLAGLALGAGAMWYGIRARFLPQPHAPSSDLPAGPAEAARRAWDRESHGRAWHGRPQETVDPPPPGDTDRDHLIASLIDLADRLRDHQPGLWKAANRRLEAVGVQAHLADGEPFDPERHRAVGYRATDEARLHLTIAATERVGYTDRGKTLRVPEVIVFRATGDPHAR